MSEQGKSQKQQTRIPQPVSLAERIERKMLRKIRARQSKEHSAWFGLGMMGTIGWTVVVPTLLGIAAGIWLDGNCPGSFSWTLTLLITGLILGCINAWMWISREQESIEKDKKNDGRNDG